MGAWHRLHSSDPTEDPCRVLAFWGHPEPTSPWVCIQGLASFYTAYGIHTDSEKKMDNSSPGHFPEGLSR